MRIHEDFIKQNDDKDFTAHHILLEKHIMEKFFVNESSKKEEFERKTLDPLNLIL